MSCEAALLQRWPRRTGRVIGGGSWFPRLRAPFSRMLELSDVRNALCSDAAIVCLHWVNLFPAALPLYTAAINPCTAAARKLLFFFPAQAGDDSSIIRQIRGKAAESVLMTSLGDSSACDLISRNLRGRVLDAAVFYASHGQCRQR